MGVGVLSSVYYFTGRKKRFYLVETEMDDICCLVQFQDFVYFSSQLSSQEVKFIHESVMLFHTVVVHCTVSKTVIILRH